MTREEIRERVAILKQGFDKLVRENAKAETLWYYLNINGVVVKVDRELPKSYFGGQEYIEQNQFTLKGRQELLDAGYVAVEPLIEILHSPRDTSY